MLQASRAITRAVLGPTNTGKTHYAIERMLAHRTGVIGLPLRLLAREVYDRIVAMRGPSVVALVTGEERIVPERAAYWVCIWRLMRSSFVRILSAGIFLRTDCSMPVAFRRRCFLGHRQSSQGLRSLFRMLSFCGGTGSRNCATQVQKSSRVCRRDRLWSASPSMMSMRLLRYCAG